MPGDAETLCAACGRATTTINGLCPHCGTLKDPRRAPPPRTEPLTARGALSDAIAWWWPLAGGVVVVVVLGLVLGWFWLAAGAAVLLLLWLAVTAIAGEWL